MYTHTDIQVYSYTVESDELRHTTCAMPIAPCRPPFRLANMSKTMAQAVTAAQLQDLDLELPDAELEVLTKSTDNLARGVPGRNLRTALSKEFVDKGVAEPRAKQLCGAWSLAYKELGEKESKPLAVKALLSARIFTAMKPPPEGFKESSAALSMLEGLKI